VAGVGFIISTEGDALFTGEIVDGAVERLHIQRLDLPLNEIAFEQFKPDYLLWGPLRSIFASSSTPAGCLLQLKHGLDEGARGAKSGCKKSYWHCGGFSFFVNPPSV
jgi:hypothetical protein